jgi:hypothetical protein
MKAGAGAARSRAAASRSCAFVLPSMPVRAIPAGIALDPGPISQADQTASNNPRLPLPSIRMPI